MQTQDAPLSGIRVVELTIWMSGPVAGMLLGDLGADVIKIEAPSGDPTRRYVPVGKAVDQRAVHADNYAYAQCNRNKRNVVLDLRSPEGRDDFAGLLRSADVFLTNIQIDTLSRLGADEATVKAVNPEIVYAYAGGLGHTGPRAADRCQDMLGMAYAGMLFTLSSEPGEPFAPPGAMNDVLTGTMTAFGVLASLLHRGKTGSGGGVSTSLLHTSLWSQMVQFGTVANAPDMLVPPKSRRNPRSPGLNQYVCKDGRWIAVAAVTASAWSEFVRAADAEDLIAKTGLTDYAAILDHAAEVRELFDEHFLARTSDEWLAMLIGAGVWCSRVNHLEELWDDEQVVDNGYLIELEDGLRTVAMPFTLSGYTPPRQGASALGADTDTILVSREGSSHGQDV